MNHEDLEREINQLWAKVSISPAEFETVSADLPPSWEPQGSTASGLAAMEAIALLKRQHREQLGQWERMLTLKDQALKEISERLHVTEKELIELRRLYQQADTRTMADASQAVLQMESARRTLQEHQERAAQEEARLRDILDKTRQQLAAETNRWRELERQWGEREQQYLSDLHDLQARLTRAEEITGKHEDRNRGLTDQLSEAKKSIEDTMAQLANEKQSRETSDQERDKAVKKVAEVSDHLREIENIWAEERKQWQELWDRERSTWETQRQEFGTWESRLRQEREKWHADLKQKEVQELKFATDMTQALRESAETTAKMKEMLKTAASAFMAPVSPAVSVWIARSIRHKRMVWTATLAVVLGLAIYPIWRYVNRIHFTLLSAHHLTLENPTAIAFDGNVLWASEWSGRLLSLDPADPSTVVARYDVTRMGAYHPASLALGGNTLWSLDNSQSRILRHNLGDPSKVEASWPSPGPAPVALAYDGQNLWSCDAVNKAVYRHMGEGPNAQVDTFPLESDIVPTAMQWVGSQLWIYDSKNHRIFRLQLGDKSLQVVDSVPFDPSVTSMALYRVMDGELRRRMMWALSGPDGSGSFTLKKFRISP